MRIKEKVEQAALTAGKPVDAVRIVVASKYSQDISELIALKHSGAEAFGENRLQSLEDKHREALSAGETLKWHFIGHIQSNKVKKIVWMADLIHSVDSVKIAGLIDREANSAGKIQKILLQLKVSAETSKTGFTKDEIGAACGKIVKMANMEVDGLMVIPPMVSPDELVPHFRLASNTLTELQSLYNVGGTLSMGMSGDFELAIQEGSNMVRVGSAIWR